MPYDRPPLFEASQLAHNAAKQKAINMTYRDPDFPTIAEIKRAATEFVQRECDGEWPEDAWFDLGDSWSVDVWEDYGHRRITVYRDFTGADGDRETDCSAGICIQ